MMDLTKAHDYYLRVEQLSPLKPTAFYVVGSLDWIIVYDKKTPHTPEEKSRYIEEGLQHLDIAIALDPDYDEAMTYRNLLLREKALLAPNPAETQRLTLEADQWFNKALETRKRKQSKATPSEPFTLVAPPPRLCPNNGSGGHSPPFQGGVAAP